MIDKINHNEIENPFYKPTYFDKNITEIHFYHNLIVIKKDENLEKSNILVRNRRLVGGKNLVLIRTFIKNVKYFYLHYIDQFKSLFRNIFN